MNLPLVLTLTPAEGSGICCSNTAKVCDLFFFFFFGGKMRNSAFVLDVVLFFFVVNVIFYQNIKTI